MIIVGYLSLISSYYFEIKYARLLKNILIIIIPLVVIFFIDPMNYFIIKNITSKESNDLIIPFIYIFFSYLGTLASGPGLSLEGYCQAIKEGKYDNKIINTQNEIDKNKTMKENIREERSQQFYFISLKLLFIILCLGVILSTISIIFDFYVIFLISIILFLLVGFVLTFILTFYTGILKDWKNPKFRFTSKPLDIIKYTDEDNKQSIYNFIILNIFIVVEFLLIIITILIWNIENFYILFPTILYVIVVFDFLMSSIVTFIIYSKKAFKKKISETFEERRQELKLNLYP
ncbi:MAG: hypothetical protein ACTSRG_25740 [Candidatus Helarchaeota archaeon]